MTTLQLVPLANEDCEMRFKAPKKRITGPLRITNVSQRVNFHVQIVYTDLKNGYRKMIHIQSVAMLYGHKLWLGKQPLTNVKIWKLTSEFFK